MFLRRVKIRSYQKGLLFRDKEFKRVLPAGSHWCVDPTGKTTVDIVSMREPWLEHRDLDLMVSSGRLNGDARIIELSDSERGLVWIENRFDRILGPGQYALWHAMKEVRVEVVDIGVVRFSHDRIGPILESATAAAELAVQRIGEGMVGILFLDGHLREVLAPGLHVFWKKAGEIRVVPVETRESILDVSGQEIITGDKVSLRINGLTVYRVVDPRLAVTAVEDYRQALYRETQLALRSVVGTTELDMLLADKDLLAGAVSGILAERVKAFGVKVIGVGLRDLILPGEMRELFNRVVESKKAAEANLITRREETAAMRSQANTARILADNPTLMRLRELEVLEKVAANSQLSIVCGDSLAEKVIKLI